MEFASDFVLMGEVETEEMYSMQTSWRIEGLL